MSKRDRARRSFKPSCLLTDDLCAELLLQAESETWEVVSQSGGVNYHTRLFATHSTASGRAFMLSTKTRAT